MSRSRWLLSVAFVAHLGAFGLSALPPPQTLERSASTGARQNSLVRTVAPLLDWALARVSSAHHLLWRLTGPVRAPASAYLGMLKLDQRWSMFWNPPQIDKYLRVRYYIASSDPASVADSALSTVDELVLPVDREDARRGWFGYGNVSVNKAIATSLDEFHRRRGSQTPRGDGSRQLPDDLAPTLRFFVRRFQRQHLPPGADLTRAEIWYGSVRNPPPGTVPSRDRNERHAVLRQYYEGPVDRGGATAYPSYGAVEQEADIRWLLEYAEAP